MTHTPPIDPSAPEPGAQGNLIPPPDLRLRVRPAVFARMAGVSKQAVYKALAAGRIRADADGLLNPNRAAREWIENTNPALIRSRLLRDLARDSADVRRDRDDWRARAERAASERDRARAALSDLRAEIAERERRASVARGYRDAERLAHALHNAMNAGEVTLRELLRRHGPERVAHAIERGTLARLVDRYLAPRLLDACSEPEDDS